MAVSKDHLRRPTFREVLALTVRLIWRPRRGFRRLYHATWAQLWLAQFLWVVFLAMLIGAASFARAIYAEPQITATQPVSGVKYDDPTTQISRPEFQTAANTWERLHPDGAFGEFEIEILVSTLLAVVTNLLLLAAFWCEHYRGLAAGECLRRLLGATTAATGYGVVLILVFECVLCGIHYLENSTLWEYQTVQSGWYAFFLR